MLIRHRDNVTVCSFVHIVNILSYVFTRSISNTFYSFIRFLEDPTLGSPNMQNRAVFSITCVTPKRPRGFKVFSKSGREMLFFIYNRRSNVFLYFSFFFYRFFSLRMVETPQVFRHWVEKSKCASREESAVQILAVKKLDALFSFSLKGEKKRRKRRKKFNFQLGLVIASA